MWTKPASSSPSALTRRSSRLLLGVALLTRCQAIQLTQFGSLQVPVVHSDSLAPVRALLTKLEGEHGGRLPGQLSRWKSWGDNIALNIFSQHLLYPELASLALSPALLNTLSSLLGPDLVLLATTLFAKYPSSSELGERYTIANLKVKLTKRGAAKLTFRKQDQLKLGPENSPFPRKGPWAQQLRPKPYG